MRLGGYDHWKTTDPAERWPDEAPQEDDMEDRDEEVGRLKKALSDVDALLDEDGHYVGGPEATDCRMCNARAVIAKALE